VVATDPQAPFYEGVQQLRGIALLGGCFVIFDRVTAAAPRTIDRYQYGASPAVLKPEAGPAAEPPPCLPAKGAFTDIRGGPCGKELRIDFANSLKLRLVSDRELLAYKAITVGGYQAQPMEVTWARAEKATAVTFLAGFSFGKDAEPPALAIRESTPEKIVLEVQAGGKRHLISVAPAAREARVETP